MTDQLPDAALQNGPLLTAISSGPYASLGELAEAATVDRNNIHRKLAALTDKGLIAKTGDQTFEVEITETGRLALLAMGVFAGTVVVGQELTGSTTHFDLDPDLIDPNPFDARVTPDPIADAELARSVADKGILQRILVRPHPDMPERFQQALGHRRVRGAKTARILVPVEVRDLTDDDMLEIGIIENVQRAGLHWMDEAEGYKMLAARGKSAAQIVQLVGTGGRKKRSVQEYIQFATELDDAAKAMARAGTLTPDQARAMVGNKRAKPALDLTPKLACALLELLLAADCAGGEVGDVMEATLHTRPVGGALITLSDRALIKFKFAGSLPVVVIPITEDIAKYLHEIGYNDHPVAAVAKARIAVMGELAAGSLDVSGLYYTKELNPPEREAQDDAPQPILDDAEVERLSAESGLAEHVVRKAAETQPLEPEPLEVAPDAALILLELAHKIAVEGDASDALPSCAIDPSYRNDPMSNQLVFDRLIMFRMVGPKTAAALTPTARTWLEAREAEYRAEGETLLVDHADHSPADLLFGQILKARLALHGSADTEVTYLTPWLTVQDAPAHAVRDEFMTQVLEVTAEAKAEAAAKTAEPLDQATLTRLMAAAREVRALVATGETRRLKPAETKPALALLDAAMGDAERALQARGLA